MIKTYLMTVETASIVGFSVNAENEEDAIKKAKHIEECCEEKLQPDYEHIGDRQAIISVEGYTDTITDEMLEKL